MTDGQGRPVPTLELDRDQMRWGRSAGCTAPVSREIGHCLRMSGTPLLNKGPSARLGRHTREILLGLGYGSGEIEALAARGLVLIS